jgi:hypothetical protein
LFSPVAELTVRVATSPQGVAGVVSAGFRPYSNVEDAAGESIQRIALDLAMSRGTVRRLLKTPEPPSVAFLTNPAGLSDARLKELAELATDDARAQLNLVAEDLIATLADQRGKDGRNVALTALRKRLAFVQRLIQRSDVQANPRTATPRAGSGAHPI